MGYSLGIVLGIYIPSIYIYILDHHFHGISMLFHGIYCKLDGIFVDNPSTGLKSWFFFLTKLKMKVVLDLLGIYVRFPSGWWFGCHFLFSHIILGLSHHPNWRSPIFQRGGPGPPTSHAFHRFQISHGTIQRGTSSPEIIPARSHGYRLGRLLFWKGPLP